MGRCASICNGTFTSRGFTILRDGPEICFDQDTYIRRWMLDYAVQENKPIKSYDGVEQDPNQKSFDGVVIELSKEDLKRFYSIFDAIWEAAKAQLKSSFEDMSDEDIGHFLEQCFEYRSQLQSLIADHDWNQKPTVVFETEW